MKKNKNQSSESDDESEKSQELNTDNSPKQIPVAKLGQKLKTKKIIINVSDTQYPIINEVAEELGWVIQEEQGCGDWDVWWTDRQINPDVLYRMNLHQKINHFPGIYVLARKNMLGLHLMGMKQKFKLQYDFFPQTWVIPLQFAQFRQYYQSVDKSKATYIVKPQALSQGRGIFLTRDIEDIINGKKYVIQKYVTNPLLIDGLKFDLRIYVLIAGTDPLRLYIYEEGLARLATQKYQQPTPQNMHKSYIHLTNYSLNKSNPDYIFNASEKEMDIGHKRTLKGTYDYLRNQGHDVDKIKRQIQEVITKTVISGLPLIKHQYQYCQPQQFEGVMCFHILGFDVMLTSELKPIVIEVNHTPSFQTSTPLDYYVKKNLIKDTLNLMRITQNHKKLMFEKAKLIVKKRVQNGKRQILKGIKRKEQNQKYQRQRDEAELQLLKSFQKIHPVQNIQKQKQYDDFYLHAVKVQKQCQKTRKIMLKEYSQKQKKQQKMNQVQQKKQQKQSTPINVQSLKTQSRNSPIIQRMQQSLTEVEQSLISQKKINIKAKINKGYQQVSLAKYNQMMANFTNKNDAFIQQYKKKVKEDSEHILNLKKLVLQKKNYSLHISNEHRQGIYIVPKNYDITSPSQETKEKNIISKQQIKNSSHLIKTSSSKTKKPQILRKMSLF